MTNTRRALLLVLPLFLLLGVVPTQAQQTPDSDALIDRLEARYDGGQALRAQFTRSLSQNGQSSTLGGTITLRGDRYRVETDQQTLVSDGETTWIYTPAREQVLVNQRVEDETDFSMSRFFDGYRERYRVAEMRTAQHDGAEHRVLTLRPRGDDVFFEEVTLWVRASDAVVTRMKVEDVNESTMTFTLRDVSFDVPTTAGTFQFDAPPGTEVVDLRS